MVKLMEKRKSHVTTEKTIDVQKLNNTTTKLKVISLFSGCGGMDMGVRGDFYFNGKYYEPNPFDIVYANDIVQSACNTYEYNFKHKSVCSDIKNIEAVDIPHADIIIGGFPCQDFSVAGKRRGLEAERGRLYMEMKRIIDYHKPVAFLAENVDGINKSKSGEEISSLDIILEDFESIGYNVVYKILNASEYGVPQSRIRVIIVGIRNDINRCMHYPQITHGEKGYTPLVTSKQAIDDLWDKIDTTPIPNHTSKDYSKAKFYYGKRTQGNCRIKENSPAPTIRAEHHGNIEGHYRTLNENDKDNVEFWRRLSVRECARLQSFPDEFVFPCSASDAYKQIGNAVPPVLGWNIARALYLSLNESPLI